MSALTNPWILLGAAVVGIVTAVSVFVVEIVQEKKRQASLNRELCEMRDLRHEVTRLQLEIYELSKNKKDKKHNKQENHHRRSRANTASTTMSVTSDTDWNSAQDSSDLEFYDLSSDEEDSRASTVRALDVILEGIDNRLDSNQDAVGLKAILGELLQLHSEEEGSTSCNRGEFLWRLAKCQHKLSQVDGAVETKSQHIQLGVDYCLQELDGIADNTRNETVGNLNKWLAICLGAQIELITNIRDKIRSSMQFKRALDAAVQYLPNDPTVQYMLGRWALEVGALSWVDRKALSLMGGGDIGEVGPEAALPFLVRANDIEANINGKGSKETKVCLAKALLAARGDTAEAVKHLQDAQSLPKSATGTDKVDIELKTLLAKYNSYT